MQDMTYSRRGVDIDSILKVSDHVGGQDSGVDSLRVGDVPKNPRGVMDVVSICLGKTLLHPL